MIHNGEKYNYEGTEVMTIEGTVVYSAFADGVILRHPADTYMDGALSFAVVPNEYDDLVLEAVGALSSSEVADDQGDLIQAHAVIPGMQDTDDTSHQGRLEAAKKVGAFGDVIYRVLDRIHGNVPEGALFGIEAMQWVENKDRKVH